MLVLPEGTTVNGIRFGVHFAAQFSNWRPLESLACYTGGHGMPWPVGAKSQSRSLPTRTVKDLKGSTSGVASHNFCVSVALFSKAWGNRSRLIRYTRKLQKKKMQVNSNFLPLDSPSLALTVWGLAIVQSKTWWFPGIVWEEPSKVPVIGGMGWAESGPPFSVHVPLKIITLWLVLISSV